VLAIKIPIANIRVWWDFAFLGDWVQCPSAFHSCKIEVSGKEKKAMEKKA
jgi:hypothetical protein